MDRNIYEDIRMCVCGRRSCSRCQINHNMPCTGTSDYELISYARHLYIIRDPYFMEMLEKRKNIRNIVLDRIIGRVI